MKYQLEEMYGNINQPTGKDLETTLVISLEMQLAVPKITAVRPMITSLRRYSVLWRTTSVYEALRRITRLTHEADIDARNRCNRTINDVLDER